MKLPLLPSRSSSRVTERLRKKTWRKRYEESSVLTKRTTSLMTMKATQRRSVLHTTLRRDYWRWSRLNDFSNNCIRSLIDYILLRYNDGEKMNNYLQHIFDKICIV